MKIKSIITLTLSILILSGCTIHVHQMPQDGSTYKSEDYSKNHNRKRVPYTNKGKRVAYSNKVRAVSPPTRDEKAEEVAKVTNKNKYKPSKEARKKSKSERKFAKNHQQNMKAFANFTKLSDSYTRSYGEPEQITTWNSNLDKNVPDNWGIAISRGEVDFVNTWYTTKSTIVISLTNVKGNMITNIKSTPHTKQKGNKNKAKVKHNEKSKGKDKSHDESKTESKDESNENNKDEEKDKKDNKNSKDKDKEKGSPKK